MSSRNLTFFVVVIVILIVFIFFAPAYGWKLHAWLGPHGDATGQDVAALAAQNEVFAAQLAELQVLAAQIPNAPSSTIRAMVYSRYPLNFKNEILINAGANEGVVAGRAVARFRASSSESSNGFFRKTRRFSRFLTRPSRCRLHRRRRRGRASPGRRISSGALDCKRIQGYRRGHRRCRQSRHSLRSSRRNGRRHDALARQPFRSGDAQFRV